MLGAKYMVQSINRERTMSLVILAVVITGSLMGFAVVRFLRRFH